MPTAPWSVTAGGSVANVAVTTLGSTLDALNVAQSAAGANSQSDPRTSGVSQNVGTGSVLTPLTNSISAGGSAGSGGSTSGSLLGASIPSLLTVGALTTADSAHWTADSACVLATQLSTSSTTLSSLVVGPSLGPAGSSLLSTGVGTSTGSTVLSPNSGLNYGTTSTSTGSIAGLQVLGGSANGGATIDVQGLSTLTAVAPGTGSGTSNYTPSLVKVNGVALTQGNSTTIPVTGGSITVRMNNPTTTLSATSVTSSVSLLTITISLPGISSTVGILPLKSTATTPSGGIDCPAPPAAPVITVPTDNTVTSSTTPTISGTSVAGASVAVYDAATLVGTTTATSGGSWSLGPTTLGQGLHALTATATTASGTSTASPLVHLTIDSVAPAAPTVSTPANNSVTSDPKPPITGTAEANSTVLVTIDGTQVGTTTATGSGSFTYSGTPTLADGPHTVSAKARDAAGNTSASSATNTFTVDFTAPAAPRVDVPVNGSVTNVRTPALSGAAEAGSTVRITVTPTSTGGTATQTVTTTASTGGSWSTAVPAGSSLNDGTYTVSAVAVDAAGNVSPTSNVNTFTVDGTAPNAPVVTTPVNGTTVPTSTPTISGTAEANTTVTVYDVTVQTNPVAIGTTPVNGAGNWALVPTTPLPDGLHAVLARATDAASNTSGPSNITTFTIDTTAPAAPVVQSPADGTLTRNATPTYSGTTDAGTTVDVYVDGTRVGAATVTGSSWTLPQATALADGSHRVYAVAKDAAGNSSTASATNTFTVDTTPPTAPVTVTPANGSSTRNTTPALTGTTVAGTTVTVYLDGTPHAATLSGTNWSYTPTSALSNAAHTVSATATDAAGNVSASSNTNTFTVDTVPPAPPVITTPPNGSTTADTTPAIAGTAEANATVTVTLDGGTLGSTTASAAGNWSISPTSPLANSTHTATATATDAAGNTSAPSATDTFTVNSAASAPTVTQPADATTITTRTPTYQGSTSGSATVTVYVDGTSIGGATVAGAGWSLAQPAGSPLPDGTHTVYAVGTSGVASATSTFTVDATPPAAPVITIPVDGAHVGTHTPTISGTAEPNSTVRVTTDLGTDPHVTTTTAGPDGRWSLTSGASLADGPHSAVAVAVDAAGNTSGPSNTVTFTVDTAAPAKPILSTPAGGAVLATHTPTYTGTAEAGSTVTVYLGGTAIGTTTTGSGGSWTLASPGYVADGIYTATATATDAAGNTSSASTAHTFTIDTTAPAAPTITSPAEGATVTTVRPPITGTAEPNSAVAVSVDGTVLGTTAANGSGDWTYTPTVDLDQGLRAATATATDAAGNTGVASAPRHFTVDTVAPDAPTIATPANGTITNDPTPTFSGGAEKGSSVAVWVAAGSGAATRIGTTTASSSDGSWSFTPTTDLADGGYTVYATATDAAGNTSGHSGTNAFTIDTAAPTVAISAPVNGSTVRALRPTLSGTAEAGSRVTVTLDTQTLGTITATSPPSGPGTWSIAPPADLAQGSHTVTASAQDAAGNTSPTATSIFSVDTVAPGAPVITTPPDGSFTKNPTPPISGTAEPGATVAVALNGTLLGSGPADPTTGVWTVTPTTPLADAAYAVSATATDAAGNASPAATSSFTVDTAAPAAPVISTPADGSYVRTATPTITGTAEKGATVAVSIDSGSLGSVTASAADGSWSIVSTHLGEGLHHVSATATDAAGNTSAAASHAFTVDTVAPSTPTITTPAANAQLSTHFPLFQGAGDPGTTITVRIDGTTDVASTTVGTNGTWSVTATVSIADGAHTAVATSADAAGNGTPSAADPFTVDTVAPDAPAIDYPGNGSTITDTTPTITGRAEAGSTVAVRIDGTTSLGTTVASAGGAWSIPVTTPLAYAGHTASATATDAAGNTSVVVTSSFTVSATAPAAPVVQHPADGSTTNLPRPPVSGTGTPGAVVTVTIDGTVVGTAPVGTDGTWTLTPPTALGPGDHVITATQQTGTGPVSATSDPVRFTVDTTPPAVPVVTQPIPGTLTNDPFPVFSGTAEPGSTVTVFVDGVDVGTTTADPTGHFSLRSAIRLASGLRGVTASATDAAGNTSVTSTSVPFTIDTVAPPPPTITAPPPGSSTTDRTPTLHGTGEPRAKLVIRANGRVLGETYVADDGTWTFTVPTPLSPGAYRFTATAIDPAGNVGVESRVLDLMITAPASAAALQATGMNGGAVVDLSWAALLLVAVGLLLLRRTRRRTH